MSALTLLLALSAPLAERLPVPPRATAAQLQTAVEQCKAKHPQGDACFRLQLALSRALLAAGDAQAAQRMAEAARRDVLNAWADADDVYISAQSKARRPEATAADKAAYVRATADWKQLWVDQAIAAEAEGAAFAAQPYHRPAHEAFLRAASIRAEYGDGPANRDARLRAAASAAVSLAGAETVAAGEAALAPVLAEARKVHGETHPLVAGIKLDRADLLASRAAFAEADRLYGEARAALASDAAARIDADSRYLRFLVRADRKREAEPLARDVLARLLASKSGEGGLATAYLDIASTVTVGDALPLVRQAVALRTRSLGDKHIETARANIVLARMLEDNGELVEAEALRRPALIAIQATNFREHPETATAYLELGENLIRQDRAKDAAYFCRNALQGFDASTGPQSTGAARAALLLAMTAFSTGSEDPVPLVRRAMPAIRAALEVTHSERLQAEYIQAMIHYYVERDPPAALRQIRIVTDAGLQRARSYRDFGPEAQFEMRRIAPAFATHVRFAWDAAHVHATR